MSIVDRHGVLDDQVKLKMAEDFACGSLSRRGLERLSDTAAVAHHRRGRRLIVTSVLPGACSLPQLRFQPRDIVVLGNEYDGLPEELMRTADLRLHIPMPNIWMPKPSSWYPIDPTRAAPVTREGTPNLNVAMAIGIICYTAYTQQLSNTGEPLRAAD